MLNNKIQEKNVAISRKKLRRKIAKKYALQFHKFSNHIKCCKFIFRKWTKNLKTDLCKLLLNKYQLYIMQNFTFCIKIACVVSDSILLYNLPSNKLHLKATYEYNFWSYIFISISSVLCIWSSQTVFWCPPDVLPSSRFLG